MNDNLTSAGEHICNFRCIFIHASYVLSNSRYEVELIDKMECIAFHFNGKSFGMLFAPR